MQGDFLVKTNDNGRVHNPYGSALLVCEHNDGYFSLVIPLEGIPTVFGDAETFDYNILTEEGKGKVRGKVEVEDATTDFMWTKENCHRLDQLKGKVLPYMIAYGNGTAVMFNAEVSYRPNDVDNGDVLKGTMTITPSSIKGDVIYDCRGMIRQTLNFAGTIPSIITVSKEDATSGYTVDVAIDNSGASAKITPVLSDASGTDGDVTKHYDVTWSSNKLTVKPKTGATAPDYCLLRLDAEDTTTKMSDGEHNKFAPSSIFIDLEYTGEKYTAV